MFTDYLPLLLVNLSAALVLVAIFYLRGVASPNPKAFAAGFAIAGLVALLGGLHLALAWPLKELGGHNVRWANIAFGEPSVLLGALLLGASLAIAKGWNLVPVGIYAVLAGGAAIAIGVTLEMQHLTMKPELSAAGFILTGLGGALALPILLWPRVFVIRLIGAVLLFAAAAIWALTGYGSYFAHISPGFGV